MSDDDLGLCLHGAFTLAMAALLVALYLLLSTVPQSEPGVPVQTTEYGGERG